MADIPTVSWSEDSPAGTQAIALGDNRIRELKTQLREVIEIDHNFSSSGQDADYGKHNQISLLEQADLGSGAEGKPILGAQTVDGKAELLFTDEDDNDVQLTSGGAILLDSGRITNDTYIKAINAAGDGTVDLIKADGSDNPTLPDGAKLATDAAPDADAEIANKKYVDDTVAALTQTTASKVTGTTDINTDSTSYVDMTNMSLELSGAGTYIIVFSASIFPPDGNGARCDVIIDIDGTDYAPATGTGCSSADAHRQQFPVTTFTVQTLGAGDHTIKAQWKVSGGTAYQYGSYAERTLMAIKIA